jgi:hypothetical protein
MKKVTLLSKPLGALSLARRLQNAFDKRIGQ